VKYRRTPREKKKVSSSAPNRALETWPWYKVYRIKDPDSILAFINEGIVLGMDLAALIKRIKVKEGALPLHLRPDTLQGGSPSKDVGHQHWRQGLEVIQVLPDQRQAARRLGWARV
jgi:hypothetical protein